MKIRRALQADIPKITDVFIAAFHEEQLQAWLYPRRHEYPRDYRRDILREIKENFYTPGYVSWVAEIEPEDQDYARQGQLAGFAIWHRHGISDAASKWQRDSLAYRFERFLQLIMTSYEDIVSPDRSASPSHMGVLMTAPDVFASILSRWHLCAIATHPRLQKRGVARALTQQGLDIAMQERVPATLESTIEAESLYRGLGFRDYSYIVLSDTVDGPALIREPVGEEGKFGTAFPPKETLVGKGKGRLWKPLDSLPVVDDDTA